MSSQRTHEVQWAMSLTNRQSAYGTPIADAALTAATLFQGPDLAEHTPEMLSDAEAAGKGHEWATTQEIERWSTGLRREFDLSSLTAGWVGAFGLGAVTSVQQGATAAFLHTMTPLSPAVSTQLPSTTIVERLDSGNRHRYQDLVVSDFEISGEGKDRLKLAVNFVGSGRRTASVLAMPALTAASFLRMSGVSLRVGPPGAEVEVAARLRKFAFGWDNALLADDGYFPGSGLFRGRCEYGTRKATLSMSLMMDGTATQQGFLENNSVLSVIITATGALIASPHFHLVRLTFPRVFYAVVGVSKEDDRLVHDIECSVMFDLPTSRVVTLEVVNTQTTYLVA